MCYAKVQLIIRKINNGPILELHVPHTSISIDISCFTLLRHALFSFLLYKCSHMALTISKQPHLLRRFLIDSVDFLFCQVFHPYKYLPLFLSLLTSSPFFFPPAVSDLEIFGGEIDKIHLGLSSYCPSLSPNISHPCPFPPQSPASPPFSARLPLLLVSL